MFSEPDDTHLPLEAILEGWGLPADFQASCWRRQHAIGKHPDASPVAILGGDLAEVLAPSVRADRVTLSTAGKLHHPAEYTRTKVLGDQPVSDVVDPQTVLHLVQAGATLILANAEAWIQPVGPTAESLAVASGCEVQAHVFATGPGFGGLDPHADGEDNFLIQLSGEKRWSLWPAAGVSPTREQAADLGEPAVEVLLRPGDVLYIPLGWFHAATAGSEGSLHLTYQVVPRFLLDVVLEQVEEALDPVLGDVPAPLGTPDRLLMEAVAEAVDHVRARVERQMD
jgi:lysine-specific demethylase/histidyl-hydroxylase NO66